MKNFWMDGLIYTKYWWIKINSCSTPPKIQTFDKQLKKNLIYELTTFLSSLNYIH